MINLTLTSILQSFQPKLETQCITNTGGSTHLLQDGCFPGIQLPCPEMSTICRGTVSGLWFWKYAVTLSFTGQQSPPPRLRTKISDSNNCGSFDRDKAATSPLTALPQHPPTPTKPISPLLLDDYQEQQTLYNNRQKDCQRKREGGRDRQIDGWVERETTAVAPS